jgi:AmpD protein
VARARQLQRRLHRHRARGPGGRTLRAAQYESLASLCAAIAQHYAIAHIAGHEHIAPGRKQDPGVGFDWRALRGQLGWNPQMFPAEVAGR